MSLAQSRGVKLEWSRVSRSVVCPGGWVEAVRALEDVAEVCGFTPFSGYVEAQTKKLTAEATRKAMERFANGTAEE
ncbi:hypothetical protein LCGC14_1326220 [marine sediment metagenome]|uniref:Uncharacterized protein n=1 Tax=marine sediment metagenome TaxID=412755 RepID=A0A0F9L3Z0_9ZZZZ